MARLSNGSNFADCLTVGQAATYLGVSTATLRNWDRSGKLRPRRHPQNGYRIYMHEDLEAVLRSAELTKASPHAPRIDWSAMGESEHFVQFYESDDYLIESVSGYVASALRHGDMSIVVATPEHRAALHHKLAADGVNISQAVEAGNFVVLDAQETLAKITVDGQLDLQRFNEHLGAAMTELARSGRRIYAFGEMVSLLWEQGDRHAAIRLEELWNELGKNHRFSLYCAYPIREFNGEGESIPFHGICACHSRVIPAESFSDIDSPDERLRAVSLLQQKAQSLEAEIEHRREVERALAARDREFADFFENAAVGLHKVGREGSILWANRADYELLGYSAGEYIGHSITEFHADAKVIADILARLKRGETLENCPARLRCKDGSIKHVEISSNACFNRGEFAYTRCFTRDVTLQRAAEQALREADESKDLFLATLAHELRNPLAPIRNGLDVLRLAPEKPGAEDQTLSVMERQVEQLSRLVDDLLDVSRITRDKIELRSERVELAQIVNNAIETSRPQIDLAGHQLAVELPERPVVLIADPARMAQVFSNLLNNSAKYTNPGGQIYLRAVVEGHDVVVTVRDNGVGIAADVLPHVFDMFRQADRSRSKSQGGLGIGLTLVRRLVELHRGRVSASSNGPGKGSEFTVRLPLAPPAAPATRAAHKPKQSNVAKQRILVVDDNADSGDTLSLLLRIKGHEVRAARSGLEAIDMIEDFQPQIILMDIGMPNLNGYDTTRRIRQLPGGAEIHIVALTGWGQPEDMRKSKEAGCAAHFVKPVDLEQLERLLAQWSSSAQSS